VVSEHFGSDENGDVMIVYTVAGGYVTRTFGLDNRNQALFEEGRFLPRQLKPDLSWSNSLFPLGHRPGVFHITQTHRTSSEADVVLVPAGHYSHCIRIETEAVYEDNSCSKKCGARRLRYLDWYAPNVGLIKTLVFKSGFFGSELARVELLNFVGSRS
jgi:hypothetical protein